MFFMQGIHTNGSLTCPLCRKLYKHPGDVSSLPNNPYPLQMLKMKNDKAQKSAVTTST